MAKRKDSKTKIKKNQVLKEKKVKETEAAVIAKEKSEA